ncbi:hypothetical protein IHE48_37690 [Frankia sp. CH37]|nr:hypothetical protein [Parafrankia sp. CH37]
MTGVAASVELVVLRALAKAARDRHRDATAFALDLARAATEAYGANGRHAPSFSCTSTRMSATSPPPPPSPPPSFRSGQAAADADGLDEHATIQAEPGTIKGRADQADRAKPPRRRFQLRGSRRRTGAATAAVLLLMAVSLTIWQTVGTDRGTGPDPVAVSRQLAAEASRLAGSQPDLARRMAVAAYRTAPTPQARASVLALLVEPSAGHPHRPSGCCHRPGYSPDGKLVVTRSYDGTARLWDATDSSGDAPEPLAVLGRSVRTDLRTR